MRNNSIDTHDAIATPASKSILERITHPHDIKNLTHCQLIQLCQEIRDFLVMKVSATGGHLGPNLGVVELTVAIHKVFNSPQEPIIWDTGHQTYVHKILTGRGHLFDTLRQEGGISGYPSRSESEHDWVESSHASSSLSYADGLSRAWTYQNNPHTIVAVIGDGALTGGMAWEALNNIASRPEAKIVIIVNDNGRSYSPTIGGLAKHLTFLQSTSWYEKFLNISKNFVQSIPFCGSMIYKLLHGLKVGIKDVVKPQQMFSDLHIKYLGPVDGHDISALTEVLFNAKSLESSVIVHVVTRKGKGYLPAENHTEDFMHSTGKIDPLTGRSLLSYQENSSWTEIFSQSLIELAQHNNSIVAITAAMAGPTGLLDFSRAFPGRMIDVGIAEQHALTAAAGMAMGGLHPVVAVYSTFLNRAFDQLMMDIALHSLPVTIVLDRSGITGNDGASHNGMWDLSITASIPGIRVAAPRDAQTLYTELAQAIDYQAGPTVLRFPKGNVPSPIVSEGKTTDGVDTVYTSCTSSFSIRQSFPQQFTTSEKFVHLPKVLLIGIGAMVEMCINAAQMVNTSLFEITVIDPCWIYPIPDSIITMIADYDLVVSVEDNQCIGGFSSVLSSALRRSNIDCRLRDIAIEQKFLPHASRASLLEQQGLTPEAIAHKINTWMTDIP